MKSTISIFASIFWIQFFINESGVYLEHIFQLIIAMGLTFLVIYLEIHDALSQSNEVEKKC